MSRQPLHLEPKRWSVVLTADRWTDMATSASAPKRPLRNAVARAAPMAMGALASSPERYRSIEILVDAPN